MVNVLASSADHIIISLKINLFSTWYSWVGVKQQSLTKIAYKIVNEWYCCDATLLYLDSML